MTTRRGPSDAMRALGAVGRRRAGGVLVFLLAAIVYAGTLRHELVWDDTTLTSLVEERSRQGGLGGLLASDFRLKRNEAMGYYRPAVLLSLWVDGRLAAAVPVVRHLHGVLLHALASTLAYTLLALLLGSTAGAFAGAVLFAVHPVHTESVAFVSGRTDVLCTVFVLLAAVLWSRVRAGSARRPKLESALSAVAFLLACLTKEVAFMLPAVLLAWDLCDGRPGAKAGGHWLDRNAGWLLGWALARGLTVALRSAVGVGFGGGPEGRAVGPGMRAGMVAQYLRLLIAPWPLNSWYTEGQVALTAANTVLAATFLGLCLWAAGARHRRLGLKALAWTGLFLVPVLGFAPLSGVVIAERYLYLPSFGFCAAAGWLVAQPATARLQRAARVAVPAGVAAAFALATVLRAQTWRDEASFYLAMTKSSPDASVGHDGLGRVSLQRGDAEGALRHYRAALEKEPGAHRTLDNLGNALMKLGRGAEAIRAYRAGLESRPDSPLLHFNLAHALAAEGRRAESIEHYREALRLDPDSPETLNNLAWALAAGPESGAGEAREAVGLARRACELTGWREPLYLDTLAEAYDAAGERDSAIDVATRALAAARTGGDRDLEAEILRRLEAWREPAGRRR